MSKLEIERDNVNNDSNLFEKLRGETYPLYLWGTGNVANEVYRMLSENEIELSGVFVDVDVTDKNEFKGYKIESLKQLIKSNIKINVIMGHAQYHKMSEIQSYSMVNHVYYILNPFKTHEEINEQFFYDNQENFSKAYNVFEEDYSKKVFQSYLNTRINSNIQYLLDVFEKPIDFFNNDIFELSDNENYIDIGAYTGDTIKLFYRAVNGKYDAIYGFEPDEKFYKELNKTVEKEGMQSVYSYQLGVWDQDTTLYFEKDDEQSGHAVNTATNSSKISVVSLDSFLGNKNVSLIKISLSMGNYEVLRGGGTILQKLKPKLVAIVGIKKSDLIVIPLLLKELNPEYHLYLRYLESMPSRLVVFAV